MADFKTVARVDDVRPGKVRAVKLNGTKVVLCNVEGTFFAVQDLCTHDGGPLGEGELIDHEIECPRHGGRFSVVTGEVTALPPMFPIKTYPVRIEGDEVQVALE